MQYKNEIEKEEILSLINCLPTTGLLLYMGFVVSYASFMDY